MHRQDHLLALFAAPAAPVHHPEEVGLDPTHSREAELSAEVSMLRREVADGRAVRLVDHDRLLIEVCEEVAPLLGPAGVLLDIGLCLEGHDQHSSTLAVEE